jgi:hypothetical protein
MSINGALAASFDLGVADPISEVALNGKTYKYPNVYIPAFRIVADNTTGQVQKIQIKLYRYKFDRSNPDASTFVVVTDRTVLNKVIDSMGASIGGTAAGSSQTVNGALATLNRAALAAQTGTDGIFSFEHEDFKKYFLVKKDGTPPADTNSNPQDGPYIVNFVGNNYKMFGVVYDTRGKLDCYQMGSNDSGVWRCSTL